MGITIAGWQERLVLQLQERGIVAEPFSSGGFLLLKFPENNQLILNLIPILNQFNPDMLLDLQQGYRLAGIQLIQLWEDIWLTREEQVLSRIFGLLGRNRKVHGRKTQVVTITKPESDRFFDRYHLQGSVKARYHYALTLEAEIVAVASFSAKRKMNREKPGYTSVELIRFATINGVTVQGGLSKLIKQVVRTIAPDDVMTYADLDWSYGKGYTKLGFELNAQSAPAEICLDQEHLIRYFWHRLPEEIKATDYIRIFNSGNLKYVLYL